MHTRSSACAQNVFQNLANVVSYLLCGLIYLRKNPQDRKATEFLEEGIRGLKGDFHPRIVSISSDHQLGEAPKERVTQGLLPDLLQKTKWRGQVTCYLRVYLTFQMAVIGDWKSTKVQLGKLMQTSKDFDISLEGGPLGLLSLYLKGALLQGTGKFDAALEIYESKKLDITGTRTSNLNLSESMERDIRLLASLSRVCILQLDDRRNNDTNSALIHALEPLCSSHPSQEIRTAYHLILAIIRTNPEAQLFETKRNLRAALNGAQATGNQLFICITLNVMCSRFFTDVVGPQAEKSAQAAAATASKTGNPLWKSVAEGAISRCYDVQGKTDQGRQSLQMARTYAQKAFPDP